MEVNDGTSTQQYCEYNTPGSSPVTGTTITIKLYTNGHYTASGFLAVVTGDVKLTTNETGKGSLKIIKFSYFANKKICLTSLPYFGVKLSCVCLMFASRKKSKDL